MAWKVTEGSWRGVARRPVRRRRRRRLDHLLRGRRQGGQVRPARRRKGYPRPAPGAHRDGQGARRRPPRRTSSPCATRSWASRSRITRPPRESEAADHKAPRHAPRPARLVLGPGLAEILTRPLDEATILRQRDRRLLAAVARRDRPAGLHPPPQVRGQRARHPMERPELPEQLRRPFLLLSDNREARGRSSPNPIGFPPASLPPLRGRGGGTRAPPATIGTVLVSTSRARRCPLTPAPPPQGRGEPEDRHRSPDEGRHVLEIPGRPRPGDGAHRRPRRTRTSSRN